MKTFFIFILLFSSCSFKPENIEKKEKERKQSEVQAQSLDSDGDGVSDQEETKSGSDLFIADIPSFEGDLFSEMKVRVHFYNKTTKSVVPISWVIKDEKIKLSWEEEERRSSPGRPYMDALLKNYATGVDFKKNNFKFFDYNEGVFSHSSPVIYEDSLFSISEKTLSLQREGFELNRGEATIRSQFKINSKKFTSFRNPVFDIYYKSKNREGLIFIESKRIDGTYSFNEENEVYVVFETFDQKIINDTFLSGGASFFLKLRDFTIYDTDERYSSILEKVQASSVPVTISYPENENSQKSNVETIYIGTAGKTETLKSILKKGLKDAVLMTNTSIDQIRNFSNRQRSYENSGQNETLKWYVGSSEIADNIYSYQFGPNQGIGLAYLSDKKTEKMAIYVSRTSLTNGIVASSGLLPSEAKNLKIKIVPRKILSPFENIVRFKKNDCGKGNWQVNEVTYEKIQLDYKNELNKASELIQRDGILRISSAKGIILEGNLGELFREELIQLSETDSKPDLEISLSKKILAELFKNRTQVTVEILLSPFRKTIRNGVINKISENCKFEHYDPPRGVDGGRGGGMNYNKINDFSGMGFSGEGVETEYDIDLHIFSY